jgi:protein-disulfide isomerase
MFNLTSNLLCLFRRYVVMLALVLSLFTSAPAYASTTASGSLDATQVQILEVIRHNPKVILDTLIQYQQDLDAQSQQAKSDALMGYQKDPASLIKSSPVLGDRSRNRLIVEFSDFQCPYCKEAHDALNTLHKQMPNVAIAYKHFPLVQIHEQAMPAAQAAWAADRQGKFWEYHDQLFDRQDDLGDATYQAIARDLGLDLKRFNLDRQSKAAIEAINADRQAADTLNVQGTPLFVILGKKSAEIVSGGDFDAIQSALKRV